MAHANTIILVFAHTILFATTAIAHFVLSLPQRSQR
jgi:hypothetical protein